MVINMNTTEPTQFIRGESLQWTKHLADHPADVWTVSYSFRGPTGSGLDVTAVASGKDHLIEVSASTTQNLVVGSYQWQLKAVNGATVAIICSGRTVVNENLSLVDNVAGYETRSDARIALENVRAMLAKKATLDQQSYTIGNRALTRYSISELMKLEESLAQRVAKEEMKKRGSIMRQCRLRIWEGRR